MVGYVLLQQSPLSQVSNTVVRMCRKPVSRECRKPKASVFFEILVEIKK
nr:MAG TPA: hypothetical protein [Caudoviricetes sp.]